MRIAISAQEPCADATVDARFGRARCFMVYDESSGDWSSLDNATQLDALQGAGIQAAEMLAKARIEVVLTGHCGPKAFRVLNAAGIKVCAGASGTVDEALSAYRDGKLSPVSGPDVEGHWT